jgi:CRP-like cAMP-binding protein
MSPSDESNESGMGRLFEPAIAGLTQNLALSRDEAVALCQGGQPLGLWSPGADIGTTAIAGGARLILSGWACELRVLPDGRRQIFDFLMPGDISLPPRSSHKRAFVLIALTAVRCLRLAETEDGGSPVISRAMRAVRRQNEARRFNALLRVGQLTAAERTINLLLELRGRMLANGTAQGDSFCLPITQQQMADALGLSLAHVNRTLTALRRQSLLSLDCGTVILLQPARLASMSLMEP